MKVAGGAVLSAADLTAGARATADHLATIGLGSHDRVAVHVVNGPELAFLLLGLMERGVGILLVNPRTPADEAARLAAEVASRMIISDETPADAGGIPVYRPAQLVPSPGRRTRSGATADTLSLAAWRERDDALILRSSGTTGEPKLIVRSGRSVLDNTARTARRMQYRENDVLAPLLSFSHQYGLSMLLLTCWSRCSILIPPASSLDRTLRWIGQHGATAVDAVPSVYNLAVSLFRRQPDLRNALASVRLWCVGGAPLDEALAARFLAATGLPLLDGYGSSELGNIALAGPDSPTVCEVLDGVEVWITDGHGIRQPAGTVGEVVVRTPDRLFGYLRDGRLHRIDDDIFRTGDIGMLTADGSLQVLGRRSAVHRHGHVLYPDYLARKAAESCRAPVQVVPVPDERQGSRLVFVIEDSANRPSKEWSASLAGALSAHERPNRVVVVPAFPLRADGKLDIAELAGIARGSVRKGSHIMTTDGTGDSNG